MNKSLNNEKNEENRYITNQNVLNNEKNDYITNHKLNNKLYNNPHSKLPRVDTPVPSLPPSLVPETIPASALQIPSAIFKKCSLQEHSTP